MLEVVEYGSVELRETDIDSIDKISKILHDNYKEDDNNEEAQKSIKYLNAKIDVTNNSLQASRYIGVAWIDAGLTLKVMPRVIRDDKRADYLGLFLACLKSKKVTLKSGGIYSIDTKEKAIQDDDCIDINPFVIFEFVETVKKIAKKGLKKGYKRVDENLNGKIKGKIDIQKTITKNHFKSKLHYTECNYQIYGFDIIENRILKFALRASKKYIQLIKKYEKIEKQLSNDYGFLINSFELVSDVKIENKDFDKVRNSVFYREYDRALELAKIIIKSMGTDALSEIKDRKRVSTKPFWINTAALFEAYCEVLLKNNYDVIVQKQVGDNIPDFYIKSENAILDAKYKPTYQTGWVKEDLLQVSLYGRIDAFRKDGIEPRLIIIYPTTKELDPLTELQLNKIKQNGEVCEKEQDGKTPKLEARKGHYEIYKIGVGVC